MSTGGPWHTSQTGGAGDPTGATGNTGATGVEPFPSPGAEWAERVKPAVLLQVFVGAPGAVPFGQHATAQFVQPVK